jgi:hypothetical protein
MARTIAMMRPSCFAEWDKIFYFSGQQWLGVHPRVGRNSPPSGVRKTARKQRLTGAYTGAIAQQGLAYEPDCPGRAFGLCRGWRCHLPRSGRRPLGQQTFTSFPDLNPPPAALKSTRPAPDFLFRGKNPAARRRPTRFVLRVRRCLSLRDSSMAGALGDGNQADVGASAPDQRSCPGGRGGPAGAIARLGGSTRCSPRSSAQLKTMLKNSLRRFVPENSVNGHRGAKPADAQFAQARRTAP